MPVVTEERRLKASRQDTVRTFRQTGLDRKFSLANSFLSSFIAFSRTVEGGSKTERLAKDRATYVSRYLYYCDSDEINPSFLSHKNKINEFITDIRQKTTASASSMKNILRAIGIGVSYLKKTDHQRFHGLKGVKRYIKKLQSSLNDTHKRRKQYVRVFRLEEDAAKPDLKTAPRKIRDYGAEINKLIAIGEGLTNEEKNMCTSYLVTRTAVDNASRPSHIVNLTMEEFYSAKRIGSDFVAHCGYSKTGVAAVTFSKELQQMVRDYIMKVRAHIPNAGGGGTGKVFVNNRGNTLTNISSDRHLYKILRLAGIKGKFTLTMLRKAVTSNGVRAYADDPSKVSLLHAYLNHSPEVANEYYASVRSREELHQGYLLVQRLLTA